MSSERFRQDDGVALVVALLAVTILSGLIVVFLARSINETRFGANSRDFETTLHVAEAGADRVISVANLQKDSEKAPTVPVACPGGAFDGTDPDCFHSYPSSLDGLSGTALFEAERSWVLTAVAADLAGLLDTGRGQAYGIRPCDTDAFAGGDPLGAECDAPEEVLDVVFGLGVVPGWDADGRETRVIRIQIDRQPFVPDHALLSANDLRLGGNASILAPGCDPATPDDPVHPCNADVHVNGDVNVTGSSHTIQGGLTYSGTLTGSANTAAGASQKDDEEVPDVRARDFYDRKTAEDEAFTPDPGGSASVDWHDLCPDGKIRAWHADGPCHPSAPIEWTDGAAVSDSLGWDWIPAQNTWKSNGVEAGVFYIYHADADVTGTATGTLGTTRSVTIFVEGSDALPTTSGSLQLGGNPDMVAAFPNTLFVTDRDIKMKGTSSGGPCPASGCTDKQTYSGFVFVGEQLDVSGTVNLQGAMIVSDREDVHGLVRRQPNGCDPEAGGACVSTTVSGTMTLDFDAELSIDLTGLVTVTYWNEI